MTLTLPTAPRARAEIPPQKACVFLGGPAKSGKSTLASNFGGLATLTVDTQEGTLFLDGEHYVQPIKNWTDFVEVVNQLEKGSRFKTVVIDMVADLWRFCDEAYAGKDAPSASATDDFQRAIRTARADFMGQINRLLHAGIGLWFISHTREVMEKEQVRHKIEMPDAQIRTFLVGLAQYVWIIENDGAQRVVVCQPSPRFEAGSRTPGFPDTLPLDPREVYRALNKHLNPSKNTTESSPEKTEVAA